MDRRRFLVAGSAALLGACAHRPARRAPRAMSRIGMGTYTLGDDPARRADELAALRLGLDLGLRHLDTAEMYGDGRSEALVGEAIRGRREQVFLCTKIRPDRASHAGTLAACEESLARLGTDHVDLYLLHAPPTRHPLEETLRAFDELVDRGRVRAIGVSNFETVAALDEARRLARHPIACDQVKHSLGDRHVERALGQACRARGVALVGYMPFEGFPGPEDPRHAVLTRLARAQGASPHQVVLAFLARRGVFQIPRASRLEHVRDNAGALSLELSPQAMAELEAAFPG